MVAGFKASGVTMSTREPSAELSISSSSRNMKNPTGWENSTRTSMSLSSFCSPQYHLKNCLNSSTVISACLRMAISVPFFNSLCRERKIPAIPFAQQHGLKFAALFQSPVSQGVLPTSPRRLPGVYEASATSTLIISDRNV